MESIFDTQTLLRTRNVIKVSLNCLDEYVLFLLQYHTAVEFQGHLTTVNNIFQFLAWFQKHGQN